MLRIIGISATITCQKKRRLARGLPTDLDSQMTGVGRIEIPYLSVEWEHVVELKSM